MVLLLHALHAISSLLPMEFGQLFVLSIFSFVLSLYFNCMRVCRTPPHPNTHILLVFGYMNETLELCSC